MKTTLNILLLFLSITLYAQEKTYTEKMDSLMQYVDKSQMTTPILYDRVFSFSDLDVSQPASISYDYFLQSWSELYRANYQPNFISPEALREEAKNSIENNQIQIGVINLRYNYIDFGTDEAPNLVFEDGYFRNVPGRSPFKEAQISLVSPLVQEITSPQVNYVLTSATIAQDPALPHVTSVQADFGNGVVQTIPISSSPALQRQSQTFSATYKTSGTKNISFKINFEDGKSKTINQQIEVKLPAMPAALATNRIGGLYDEAEDFTGANGITQSIPFQGYNESSAKSGVLEFRTYYNRVTNPGYTEGTNGSLGYFSEHPKLRKPVIILDGFDPGDGRKIVDLYNQMQYDPDNNIQTNNSKNLITELQNKGFDVTLVNFPNGADFIERNAMAVVELLIRENAKLTANGSNEKITLIGPSMGGLISRYALAYMEKNNIPHNTKLWVSFDSPHHGANIPISLQRSLFFFGFVGGKEMAKNKWTESFTSPAARQMLIEQMDNYPERTTTFSLKNMNNQHPFRKQFLQNLTSNGVQGSNGFPTLSRNIAIANGTTNGKKTNNETETLLDLAGFYGFFKYKAVVMVANNLPAPGNSYLNFEGKISNKVKCRKPFTNQYKPCGLDIYSYKFTHPNYNPNGSMDVVQGGTFNTPKIIREAFQPVLEEELKEKNIEWRQFRPSHSFIPTVSSLAFKIPNFDWNSDISRNLLCNKEIPFDNYFVAKNNEEHVWVTNELVDWLTKEIEGKPEYPISTTDNITIAGSSLICQNQTTTYSFNSCAMSGMPQWSVSGAAAITSQTSSSVSIIGTGNGTATVTASFSNGQNLSKTIWIGAPKITLVQNQSIYNRVSVEVLSAEPGVSLTDMGVNTSNILWKRKDTGATKTGNTNYSIFLNSSLHPEIEIEATVENPCGKSSYSDYFYPDSPPPCDNYGIASKDVQNIYYIIDPCRNTMTSTLSATERSSNTGKMENLTIKVYNSLGTEVLTQKGDSFSLNHLPTGVYYVKILKNGSVVHSQSLTRK